MNSSWFVGLEVSTQSKTLECFQLNPFLCIPARNFDVRKAESMLRKVNYAKRHWIDNVQCTIFFFCFQSVEWRKTYDVDNLLNAFNAPEVLKKYDIGGRCGFDKELSPLWIYMNANLDTKGWS